jgi:hypothetical protein
MLTNWFGSASLVLSNPGTFRASLLSTALSYSWLSGGLRNSDMEEALLSHKLEAMRVVNAQIADPVLRTSDGCLSLIAALALVEVSNGSSRLGEGKANDLAEHRAGWATMLPPRRISRGCLR